MNHWNSLKAFFKGTVKAKTRFEVKLLQDEGDTHMQIEMIGPKLIAFEVIGSQISKRVIVSAPDINRIALGRTTERLMQRTTEESDSQCFSIVTDGKVLDFQASNGTERAYVVQGLLEQFAKGNDVSLDDEQSDRLFKSIQSMNPNDLQRQSFTQWLDCALVHDGDDWTTTDGTETVSSINGEDTGSELKQRMNEMLEQLGNRVERKVYVQNVERNIPRKRLHNVNQNWQRQRKR